MPPSPPVPAAPDGPDQRPVAFGVPRRRQQIVLLLADAYAEDNLDLNEYERRVDAAERARTMAELNAVVADFPTTAGSGGTGGTRSADDVFGFAGATDPPVQRAGGLPVFTIIGDRDIRVRDAEQLPPQVVNVIGDTRLDLRDLPPGRYDLQVVNVIGDTELLVPPGTVIERRLLNLIGDVSERQQAAGAQQHVITLRGFSLIGDLKIRD